MKPATILIACARQVVEARGAAVVFHGPAALPDRPSKKIPLE